MNYHHMNRHGMRVTDAVALGDVLGRLYGPAAVEEARGVNKPNVGGDAHGNR